LLFNGKDGQKRCAFDREIVDIQIPSSKVIIVVTESQVFGLSIEDLKELWSLPKKTSDVVWSVDRQGKDYVLVCSSNQSLLYCSGELVNTYQPIEGQLAVVSAALLK
jgi:hypothetical protein